MQHLFEPADAHVAPSGLHRRWLAFRNRLLASPRFRRAAHRFWPTRRIAQRQASELFDLIAGFAYSQILMACVRLDVFDRLRSGPLRSDRLAGHGGLDELAWSDLLRAAASLDLLSPVGDGEYVAGRLGVVMMEDASLQAMVHHHEHLYRDLVDPVALMRGDTDHAALNAYWPYAGGDGLSRDAATRYSDLMAASQPMVAEQVIDAFDFRRFRRLLDVGGGSGAFLRAVAVAAPDLELSLFDLPPVADLARQSLADAGLAARSSVHGGDFRRDALPQGHDLISLVRIAHDHDDDTVLGLLERIRDALAPGGAILIAEPMAGTREARRMGDAYFRVYLRAMGTGRPRTPDELAGLLRRAGFRAPVMHKTTIPMLARVLSCQVDT
ncbi:MAG: methyltransferase [Pseudomonadota bacterium]